MGTLFLIKTLLIFYINNYEQILYACVNKLTFVCRCNYFNTSTFAKKSQLQ